MHIMQPPAACRTFAGLLPIVTVAFFLTGCSLLRPARPVEGPVVERVAERLDELRSLAGQCRGFEADAEVTFDTILQDMAVSGFVIAAHPAAIRFVGMTPFGQPLMIAASDGRRVQYVDVVRQTAYAGAAEADAIRRYFRNPQIVADGYFLLAGQPVACAPADLRVQAGDGGGYEVSFRCSGGEIRHSYLLASEAGAILRYRRLQPRGSIQAEIVYRGREQATGCGYPMNIEASGAGLSGTLTIRLNGHAAGDGGGAAGIFSPVPAQFQQEELH
ncbi:MAG: hypothetical protein AB1568_03255 [Thermodesulfobacteriota bacterium]